MIYVGVFTFLFILVVGHPMSHNLVYSSSYFQMQVKYTLKEGKASTHSSHDTRYLRALALLDIRISIFCDDSRFSSKFISLSNLDT